MACQVCCLTAGVPSPVHVDEDRQVLVPGVEFVLAADHRRPELVQDEEFLGQVALCGEAASHLMTVLTPLVLTLPI